MLCSITGNVMQMSERFFLLLLLITIQMGFVDVQIPIDAPFTCTLQVT